MKTFFSSEDYQAYIDLLIDFKSEAGVDIWAYCLMPNHVHLVVVPNEEDSLARLFRQVHRRYTRRVNFRENWQGHLWQERFHSFVMDERYLLATVRYVELNPVRAKLCSRAEEWRWSSARAHLGDSDDGLVTIKPMLERVANWRTYLSRNQEESETCDIRKHSRTGRPAGCDAFISQMEALSGRTLMKRKPGRKPGN